MASWANGDIIKIVTRMRSATGEDILNVFHYRWEGDPIDDSTGFETLRNHMDAIFDIIASDIPADVAFIDIDCTNVTQEIFYGTDPWPSLTVGGGSGDTMPEQCCALVTATTNRSKTLGKKFLGPFIEAANSDGTWYGTLLSALANFAAAYIADVTVTDVGAFIPVLVHYVGNVLTYVTDIVGNGTSNQVFTQRRRRRGVGA